MCLYICLYSLSTFIWYTCIIWGVVCICIYLGVQVSCSLSKYSRGYLGLWSMVCVGAALLTPFNLAVCLCYSFFLIPIPFSSWTQAGIQDRLGPNRERPGELISIFSLLLVKYLLKLCRARRLPLLQKLFACKHTDLGWGRQTRREKINKQHIPIMQELRLQGRWQGQDGSHPWRMAQTNPPLQRI